MRYFIFSPERSFLAKCMDHEFLVRFVSRQNEQEINFYKVCVSKAFATAVLLFLFFTSPKKRTKRKDPFFKVFFEHCPKTRTALLNFLQGFKNSLRKAILTLVKKEGDDF